MAPSVCPNCGAKVPKKAKACPECGSCEETGWAEDAYASGLNLPDEEFNYDDYLEKEFGGAEPGRKQLKWYYVIAAMLVLLGLIWWIRR